MLLSFQEISQYVNTQKNTVVDDFVNQMTKKRIALNLAPQNAFLKDVSGVTLIVNYLVSREFGDDYLEDQEDNELFEAQKIIAARRLKQRIQKEYAEKTKAIRSAVVKFPKKQIALYLEPQNAFLKDTTGITLIVNYLISEEFGYEVFPNNPQENELLEAQKIIMAVRFVKQIKEEKAGKKIIEALKKIPKSR